jgi:hypothetical protein
MLLNLIDNIIFIHSTVWQFSKYYVFKFLQLSPLPNDVIISQFCCGYVVLAHLGVNVLFLRLIINAEVVLV